MIESESISCVDLSKNFGGVRALDNATVEIPPRGIIAIIGPNGAGKTTLFNVVTGFVSPDAGRVSIGDHNLTNCTPQEIARLGVARTFQRIRLVRQVSVLENVQLATSNPQQESLWRAFLRFGVASEEKKNRRRAHESLEYVGLATYASELAGSLSYGQQKLLSIARCLATGAQIFLLDEPVSGVHPDMIEKILTLLQSIRDDGKLIVFIEHDISFVRSVADYLLVMDSGDFVAEGAPQEVLSSESVKTSFFGEYG